AIIGLLAALGGERRARTRARKAEMRERVATLDAMFTEVERIGRTIHLISLNASVEAARAGGESGRSFKVIADEIRALAHRAAEVIDTTRDGLRAGTEGVRDEGADRNAA
ncbi:MAG: methyl-accepting chemotaxis protein, partial [Shimia sp.]